MREAWDDGERPIPSNALGMKINEGAMQFLPEDLKTAIERMRLIGSDTQHYEVKAAGQGLPESLAETVSAFANRDGGTIILGLDEKNRFAPVVGFNAKSVADALLRLGNNLTPPCRLEIERYPFEGSEIVVGAVGPVALDQRPCFITRKGVWTGSYIRTGDGDKRLTNYEIDRMREFHRQPAFDREPVYEASLSDLDHSVLEAIVKRNRQITPRVFGKMESHEILEKLGAVTRDEKSPDRYVPTLAGLLVAGKFPQEFFPRLNITFSVYSGITKAQAQRDSWRYVESLPVNGSIPEMLMTSMELLDKHMNHGAIMQGALRRDVTDYPILACREAIVNALQHRDYSPEGRGSQVQINMYADRLEILNPGGLYGAASLSTIPVGISATRNARLSQLLEFTPYLEMGEPAGYVIENRGTGLQQIKRQLSEALMPEAEIKDYVSAFQITFLKRRLTQEEGSVRSWDNFEVALVSELQKRGSLTVTKIMESSGLSRNAVSIRLRRLKERGLIEPLERPKSPRQRYRLVRRT